MNLRSLFLLSWVATSLCAAEPAMRRYGFQAGVGTSSGDLADTSNDTPCLDLGVHVEFPALPRVWIRARLDNLTFANARRTGTGSDQGVPWVRHLDTRVRAWSLGAEGLAELPGLPRVRLGAGLHAIRWSVASTSTLVIGGPDGGSVVERNTPSWTRLGVSALADLRLGKRVWLEGRLLTSPYGWEGERVNLLTVGLACRF